MDSKKKLSSSPLCLISAIVWGTAFPIQEMASEHSSLIDAFSWGGIRMLVAFLALIPVVLLFERHADYSKKQVLSTAKWGALAGVILFLASTLQQLGIEMTKESGKAGFITSLYLVFVPVISLLLFKEKLSYIVLCAMPFAVAGLYFLSFSEGFTSVQAGDLLVLACSVLYAMHIITFDKSANHVNPLLFSCIQFLVAGILGVITGSLFGTFTWDGVVATAFPTLYCGIFSAGVAYTCQLLGQKNGNPTVCALFCSTEALFAVIAECVIESHLPNSKIILGCVLMLVAVVLSQLPPELFKRKKSNT